MVQTTTKFRLHFDDKQMLFEESYPEQLQTVLPREEYMAVVKKLNYDLNQACRERFRNLHEWITGTAIACCFLVGVFVVPVVWYKSSKTQTEMEQFWLSVRDYLTTVNRQGLIRRGLEWKVVEERAKIKGHDAVNKVYCLRVDLIWRQGVAKSKKTLEREQASGRRLPTVREESATSSTTAATGAEASALSKTEESSLPPVEEAAPPTITEPITEAEPITETEPISEAAPTEAVTSEAPAPTEAIVETPTTEPAATEAATTEPANPTTQEGGNFLNLAEE